MVDGPVVETVEIETVVVRLVREQHGQDACDENDAAIYHLREAQRALSLRDLRRPRSLNAS